MTNIKTLQDCRDVYYAILKEDEDSSAYPLVLADALLTSTQQSICSGIVIDLTSQRLEELVKGSLPFLFSDIFYTSVQDIYLNADAVIGGNTLSISDSSSFNDSGALWINENKITYTGNTGTGFTGVSGILFNHKSGDKISQLFELPSDYATPVRCTFNNQITLTPIDYRNIFLNLNNNKAFNSETYFGANYNQLSRSKGYTIINGSYLLPIELNATGYMIHLMYEKKAVLMSEKTDLCTIPDEYSQVTIPVLAAAKTLYNRGEEDRGLSLYRFALAEIKSMYSFFSSTNKEEINGQRVTTGKDQVFNI